MVKYALEGSSNFTSWKDHIEAVLEDNVLNEFVKIDIPKPRSADVKDLIEWRKCVAKERKIILDGVQDDIVSNLHGKETLYVMWQAKTDLF